MHKNYYLDKTLPQPLYLQLYRQIKENIQQEKLIIGDKLPSKRQLCDHLQISQNTVESAYGQLVAEGYIEPIAKKGFFVCFRPESPWQAAIAEPPFASRQHIVPASPKILFDLNPNRIDQAHFPFERWRKCGRNIRRFFGRELLALGDGQGDNILREQITRYLAESRGVNCRAEQIIVAAGAEGCLQRLILLFNQLFPNRPPTYAMEPYGYENVRQLLRLYRQSVVKMPLKQNSHDLDLDFFDRIHVNIAYLTPSNIYPFGQVLSVTQRQKLLAWVNQSSQHYIIEDDYDSEFRYKGKPIPSLQSMDNNRKVIYLGSFSKLLMPSLRVGFMVLPEPLLAAYRQHCAFFHSSISRFEQHCLAEFIRQNEFEKHINRMRKIYREKMAHLCRLLSVYRHKLRYYGEHSGFHLLIELTDESRSVQKLNELALNQGVRIYPVAMENKPLFALGFANLTETQMQAAIKTLAIAWNLKEN